MSPLDARKVSVFMWSVGPLNPADPQLGISPSCPTALLPTLPVNPEIPAPRKELEFHCRGDVVLSCRICTAGGDKELSQGRTHNPIAWSQIPHPTPQPGTIPLPGKGEGNTSLLHILDFLFCCITSSDHNKEILNFIAKALLPSGLALSLQVG